jgi:hypothetical protein
MISFVQGEDKIDLSRIDANQTNNVPPPRPTTRSSSSGPPLSARRGR